MQDGSRNGDMKSDLREGCLRHVDGQWEIPIMVGGYDGDGDAIVLLTRKHITFNKGTHVGPDGKKTVFTIGDGKIWWQKGQHLSRRFVLKEKEQGCTDCPSGEIEGPDRMVGSAKPSNTIGGEQLSCNGVVAVSRAEVIAVGGHHVCSDDSGFLGSEEY